MSAKHETPREDAERHVIEIVFNDREQANLVRTYIERYALVNQDALLSLRSGPDARDAALREARAEIDKLRECIDILKRNNRVVMSLWRKASDRIVALELASPAAPDQPAWRSSAELHDLIQRARAVYVAMTPEQRAEHDATQRESFARGNLAIDRGPDARRTVSDPVPVDQAAVERAAIVAWLRYDVDSLEFVSCGTLSDVLGLLADRIERGEHKQPE